MYNVLPTIHCWVSTTGCAVAGLWFFDSSTVEGSFVEIRDNRLRINGLATSVLLWICNLLTIAKSSNVYQSISVFCSTFFTHEPYVMFVNNICDQKFRRSYCLFGHVRMEHAGNLSILIGHRGKDNSF